MGSARKSISTNQNIMLNEEISYQQHLNDCKKELNMCLSYLNCK